MGRLPTLRNNYDDLKKLTLADLKRLGLMVPQHQASSTIKWTRRGETTGEISVLVSLFKTSGYVEFDYTYNRQEQMNYRVQLVQLPSNLRKGHVWYFICPLTGERCRTLYQAGKYFASRKTLKGTLYESQTYSKQYRWYDKTFGPTFKAERAYNELLKPYAKTHYRGKPTPKAKKVMKWEKAEEQAKVREPRSLEDYLYR
ncbi:hypothetical protein [Fibrisoma limi]|uniref:hypothetical protein n=1 Tax=Fibrisoma limi TaxID=663275 RepID=UPI000586E181|nr:hypothetical protein [Fibrisoma limi]